MGYWVFTNYPFEPVRGHLPSNNPCYIGLVSDREELERIGRELYPDLVLWSQHGSKESAKTFMREMMGKFPSYFGLKVYRKEAA